MLAMMSKLNSPSNSHSKMIQNKFAFILSARKYNSVQCPIISHFRVLWRVNLK